MTLLRHEHSVERPIFKVNLLVVLPHDDTLVILIVINYHFEAY